MGPLVVVVFDPEADPFPGRFEVFELGAHEELIPDRLPEPFNLSERHRVMRRRSDVMDPVLLELQLELRLAPPGRILPAVVRQHLLGDAILGRGAAIDLEDVDRRLAPEETQSDHVSGVVVNKADEVGVLSAEPELYC